MTTPMHITRMAEAQRMGRRAGWTHRMVINDLDRPAEQWSALLAAIRANPWAPGQYPQTDVTAQQAGEYAAQWEGGFETGDHEAVAQLRQRATVRGTPHAA
jgi:hypothetical protein